MLVVIRVFLFLFHFFGFHYVTQAVIQTILVVIAVLCVPWMLLFKPFYLRYQHKGTEGQVSDYQIYYCKFNNESIWLVHASRDGAVLRALMGTLTSKTATFDENVTLKYNLAVSLAIIQSHLCPTIWAKYPESKLVRAVSD